MHGYPAPFIGTEQNAILSHTPLLFGHVSIWIYQVPLSEQFRQSFNSIKQFKQLLLKSNMKTGPIFGGQVRRSIG